MQYLLSFISRVSNTSLKMAEDATEPETGIPPPIIPCYKGNEMGIDQELVSAGLAAISVKGPPVSSPMQSGSAETTLSMERRQKFRDLHHPDLVELPWRQVPTSCVVEDLFHSHLTVHGPFCASLHDARRNSIPSKAPLVELLPPSTERVMYHDEEVPVIGRLRSIEITDEDLSPEHIVHRSRAESCITIGRHLSSIGRIDAPRSVSLPTERGSPSSEAAGTSSMLPDRLQVLMQSRETRANSLAMESDPVSELDL